MLRTYGLKEILVNMQVTNKNPDVAMMTCLCNNPITLLPRFSRHF